ncbi:hypothetical protein ACWX0K_19355 [Nitrobacteraceae bacterium UC4446_H13]
MRIGAWILVAVLLALLAGVGWYAYSGLTAGAAPIPIAGVIALVAGVTVSLIVGVGLMALVFYSSRHGYDDMPTRDDSDEPPPREPGDERRSS